MAYQTITLLECQTRLARMYEGQPFWTADQARRAINEGLRIWNALTGMWKQSVGLITVPDDGHLFVTGVMVKASRVSMSGRILVMTSLVGLDRAVPNWEGVNTLSGGATPNQVVYWAPIGLTEIMLYPKDAPPGQNAITVEGVATTPVLVNSGDFLDMGEEELSTLLGYALHVLSIAKGITALKKTQPRRVAFYKAAAQRNSIFAASGLYRILVGYDRARDHKPMADDIPIPTSAAPPAATEVE